MKKTGQARTHLVRLLAALLFVMAGCAGRQPAADTVILNAKVYTVDAGGRLVLPGIVDSHVHFVSGSLSLARVDLAGTTGPSPTSSSPRSTPSSTR